MKNNLRKDYLPNHKEMYIYQRKDMFSLNTDTALLGEFFSFFDNESLLDIGTNNGALLLYASLKAKGKLYGIDIFKEALKIASLNLNEHNIDATLINIDASNLILEEKVDVIISNPPFFKKEGSSSCLNPFLDVARREIYLSLDSLFNTVKNNLNKEGRFYLVHRFDRKNEILKVGEKYGLYPSVIKDVYDKRVEKNVTSLFLFTFNKIEVEEVTYDLPIL